MTIHLRYSWYRCTCLVLFGTLLPPAYSTPSQRSILSCWKSTLHATRTIFIMCDYQTYSFTSRIRRMDVTDWTEQQIRAAAMIVTHLPT
jgi:hypothetical protein